VAYARDSSPDTDDEYDAMENPRTRADPVVAENLQRFFNAESDDIAEEVLPTPSPGITIGGNARLSGIPRHSSGACRWMFPLRGLHQRGRGLPGLHPSADPMDLEFVMPGLGILLRVVSDLEHVISIPLADTPLLMNLANHPSTSVRRCEVLTHSCMFLYMISCMIFLY
jgi:hypothetical protein